MIGAVVPSFDYALYARTTSALQREADTRGYALVLAAHHYDLQTEVRVTAADGPARCRRVRRSSGSTTTRRSTRCSIGMDGPMC